MSYAIVEDFGEDGGGSGGGGGVSVLESGEDREDGCATSGNVSPDGTRVFEVFESFVDAFLLRDEEFGSGADFEDLSHYLFLLCEFEFSKIDLESVKLRLLLFCDDFFSSVFFFLFFLVDNATFLCLPSLSKDSWSVPKATKWVSRTLGSSVAAAVATPAPEVALGTLGVAGSTMVNEPKSSSNDEPDMAGKSVRFYCRFECRGVCTSLRVCCVYKVK